MNTTDKDLLFKLLENFRPGFDCPILNHFDKNLVLGYGSTGNVNTKDVTQIYKTRSRLPGIMNYVIGFPELLRSLDSCPFPKLNIHFFKYNEDKIFVFTDCRLSQIVGILIIRPRNPNEK